MRGQHDGLQEASKKLRAQSVELRRISVDLLVHARAISRTSRQAMSEAHRILWTYDSRTGRLRKSDDAAQE
jgi:hypothetical protein